VRRGARVSEAYALIHTLRVQPRDPTAEHEALAHLAAWSGQYTSFVSIVSPDALLLEIEGSRNIYGGYDRLIASLRQGLNDLGYSACIAVAPTPLGATQLLRAEISVTDHAAPLKRCEIAVNLPRLGADGESLLRGPATTLIDCLRYSAMASRAASARAFSKCLIAPLGGC
jgi:protein ImuB